MTTPLQALETALENSGGAYALAAKMKLRVQSVYAWKQSGVPSKHVLAVEKVSGVPRHLLRPDLYPPCDYKFLQAKREKRQ